MIRAYHAAGAKVRLVKHFLFTFSGGLLIIIHFQHCFFVEEDSFWEPPHYHDELSFKCRFF